MRSVKQPSTWSDNYPEGKWQQITGMVIAHHIRDKLAYVDLMQKLKASRYF